MSKLTFGVIGTSKKEDEQRVPIHPDHLPRIPEEYRRQLIFEEGYGAPFGVSDSDLAFKRVALLRGANSWQSLGM